MSYSIGDAVPLVYTIAAAATVTVTVTDPDGTTSNPTLTQGGAPPAVTYSAAVAASKAGSWTVRFVATGAVTDAEDQQFIVEPVAAATLYATVGELREALKDQTAFRLDAGQLVRRLRAASRAVDRWCGRGREGADGQFWLDPTVTVREYCDLDGYWCVPVNDIGTSTGLVVKTDENGDGAYETTWSASDFRLEPLNATVNGAGAYTRIRSRGTRTFPAPYLGQPILQVTARHGWSRIPDEVREATLLKAIRLNRRPDAPFGNEGGFGDFGPIRITREDTDVTGLLAPFRVKAGFA